MFDTLKDLLLWIPRKLFADMLAAVATGITSVPVPSWYADIANIFTGDTTVHWLLGLFAVSTGMKIIISAYALRFSMRFRFLPFP